MRISRKWLLEFADFDIAAPEPQALAVALTSLGLAVDEIHEFGHDTIFELDVTTNRPDCFNHLGVARELAAQFSLKLASPDWGSPARSWRPSSYRQDRRR